LEVLTAASMEFIALLNVMFIGFSSLVPTLQCRVQLKRDGTRSRTAGEEKGKLANGVCSQYPLHYLGTWCIQHYYHWCANLGCQ